MIMRKSIERSLPICLGIMGLRVSKVAFYICINTE
jgi:hypothetical protein